MSSNENSLTISLMQPRGTQVSEKRMQEIIDMVEWHGAPRLVPNKWVVDSTRPAGGYIVDEPNYVPSCLGRHGVIRNFQQAVWREVEYTLGYYYATSSNHGAWYKKEGNGLISVEFTHMAKVSPPPGKPWEWCGETALFQSWKDRVDAQEKERKQLRKSFHLGDVVWFVHGESAHQGIITNINKRATVLIGRDNVWYVPLKDLVHDTDW